MNTFKQLPKTFLPKWQNFTKSGHTGPHGSIRFYKALGDKFS